MNKKFKLAIIILVVFVGIQGCSTENTPLSTLPFKVTHDNIYASDIDALDLSSEYERSQTIRKLFAEKYKTSGLKYYTDFLGEGTLIYSSLLTTEFNGNYFKFISTRSPDAKPVTTSVVLSINRESITSQFKNVYPLFIKYKISDDAYGNGLVFPFGIGLINSQGVSAQSPIKAIVFGALYNSVVTETPKPPLKLTYLSTITRAQFNSSIDYPKGGKYHPENPDVLNKNIVNYNFTSIIKFDLIESPILANGNIASKADIEDKETKTYYAYTGLEITSINFKDNEEKDNEQGISFNNLSYLMSDTKIPFKYKTIFDTEGSFFQPLLFSKSYSLIHASKARLSFKISGALYGKIEGTDDTESNLFVAGTLEGVFTLSNKQKYLWSIFLHQAVKKN